MTVRELEHLTDSQREKLLERIKDLPEDEQAEILERSKEMHENDPFKKKKPAEKKEAAPNLRDDAEIGDYLLDNLENVAYWWGAWWSFVAGVWKQDPRFELVIWDTLKDLRTRGVRANSARVSGVSKYINLKLLVDESEIDTDTPYINVKNGLYDLENAQLVEHRADLYITSQLPFEFDPEAKCPMFMQFLHDVINDENGHFDPDLCAVVQEAFGYSLTSNTDLRSSFWLVGLSGSGKSTLLDVLIALSGNSHFAINLDELKVNSYQLADLPGKRLVTFTEPDANGVLPDGHYKRLVSKDQITARHPYGKTFNFRPVCKLWAAMNDTPRVIDRSDAIYDRVAIIRFHHTIPHEKRDYQLDRKLLAELPGIFNWSLQGLARLNRNGGWSYSSQVERERRLFREENDTEAAFVDEACVQKPDGKVDAQKLYDAYAFWARQSGVHAKSKRKVGKDWQRLGFERKKSNGRYYYIGLEVSERFSV